VNETLIWFGAYLLAYFAGTFPSAQIVARAAGINITEVGSGNPGASNVTRALGWRKGIAVFALDAAKGVVGAGLGYAAGGRGGAYLCGAAAILGHVFPITRGLRGGKGVATAAGTLMVLHPLLVPVVIGIWWVVSRLTGTAAIGSLLAVAAAPAGLAITGAPGWEFAATIGICALIFIRHASNLQRLFQRREHRIT
jgi:acyl phosphate:glycerol-3-phosphate acyltransferase